MNNIQKYFDSPIFESSKSLYSVRYQNDLEHKLMKMFETERKIKNYHQPIMSAIVKSFDKEFFINIDFWIEYVSGKIELVYLATEFNFPEQAEIQLLVNSDKLLRSNNFGFTVVKENKFRRIEAVNLKLNINNLADGFCFTNFDWIN